MSNLQPKNSIVAPIGNNGIIQAPYTQLTCECDGTLDTSILMRPNSYHQIAMNTKCWNPYDNNQVYNGNPTMACDLQQLVIPVTK